LTANGNCAGQEVYYNTLDRRSSWKLLFEYTNKLSEYVEDEDPLNFAIH